MHSLEEYLAQTQLDLRTVEREQCRRSLLQYTELAWPIVEPTTEYVHGWHIGAICEHLEACYRREIRNLIINVPPRHMKSLCVAVMFPTWIWGPRGEASARFLCASYSESLAIRDSLKCRRIIDHPWYRARWGHVFSLSTDQNQKSRFENDATGYRLAVGVGGSATGEGGDYLIVDDPVKALDCDSECALAAANEWWDGTMSTRGNDPKTVVRIIIMQRLHDSDLTGHILRRMQEEGGENWEHLCLPAEYEMRPMVSTIGWADPRTAKDELLWPERFGAQELASLKVALGPRHTAGQLQQRPVAAGGAIYHRDWWEHGRFHIRDRRLRNSYVARWLSLDTAFEAHDSSAYSACLWFDLTPDYRLLVRYAERERLEFLELVKFTKEQIMRAGRDERLRGIIIENMASGKSLIQTLRKTLEPGLSSMVVSYDPIGDKVERGRVAAVWCEKGCVWLPYPDEECPWLFDLEDELFKFPASTFKDYADAFSQGIDYLSNFLEMGFQVRQGRGGDVDGSV